ncbi:hypothetical protein TIFTF001_052206 [Ficus carica]|uniref:Uncharacterized protein n=1 Tax=Ficus carica TaxID=3494 RepID=A0AA88EHX1_FICCA|nr:hypothetical protein TIFTF001_052206 [Ficus carica]
MEEVNNAYEVSFRGENSGESRNSYYHSPDLGFLQDDFIAEEFLFSKCQLHEQQEDKYSDFGLLNDTRVDVASPTLETCLEEIAKLGENEIPTVIPDGESENVTTPHGPLQLTSYLIIHLL